MKSRPKIANPSFGENVSQPEKLAPRHLAEIQLVDSRLTGSGERDAPTGERALHGQGWTIFDL